jgi:hypothetical protein
VTEADTVGGTVPMLTYSFRINAFAKGGATNTHDVTVQLEICGSTNG